MLTTVSCLLFFEFDSIKKNIQPEVYIKQWKELKKLR